MANKKRKKAKKTRAIGAAKLQTLVRRRQRLLDRRRPGSGTRTSAIEKMAKELHRSPSTIRRYMREGVPEEQRSRLDRKFRHSRRGPRPSPVLVPLLHEGGEEKRERPRVPSARQLVERLDGDVREFAKRIHVSESTARRILKDPKTERRHHDAIAAAGKRSNRALAEAEVRHRLAAAFKDALKHGKVTGASTLDGVPEIIDVRRERAPGKPGRVWITGWSFTGPPPPGFPQGSLARTWEKRRALLWNEIDRRTGKRETIVEWIYGRNMAEFERRYGHDPSILKGEYGVFRSAEDIQIEWTGRPSKGRPGRNGPTRKALEQWRRAQQRVQRALPEAA